LFLIYETVKEFFIFIMFDEKIKLVIKFNWVAISNTKMSEFIEKVVSAGLCKKKWSSNLLVFIVSYLVCLFESFEYWYYSERLKSLLRKNISLSYAYYIMSVYS